MPIRIVQHGLWLVLCTVLFSSGCGTGPGGAFALVPDTHVLIEAADTMRRWVHQPAPVARELSKTVIPVYVVEPGDVLIVETAFFDSPLRLPQDQTVMPDGTIDLGRFGRPVVAGMSLEEIEAHLFELIEATKPTHDGEPLTTEEMQVNVRLLGPNGVYFYVLGEVNNPGSYTYTGRETVLDAILAAGGMSDRASKTDIILSRPTAPGECRVVLPVCYEQIVQLGDTTTNYQIMPGDRIFIPTDRACDGCLKCLGLKKDCNVCNTQQCGTADCPLPFAAPVHYERPVSPASTEIVHPTEIAPKPAVDVPPMPNE
ncbi:polysaccharide biosynthesis/export family protein [Thalassoroseus pseudoceratinae]|uniref:polysaccharide biosynthesis/export family protein n=1 Tax=Thalassoroseus pseudoceratinae TaxID=2713176 RepID=UPI0014223947|nr:polysaccharide biosynthesis/export family protein [Thalassoroseus pseudoceratinae]